MSENSSSDSAIHIRRYPNRRFYDSTRSRHVKLEEIHQMVREGKTVEVTDSKTGKDITSRVLAQIMIDQDSAKMELFPASLMHLIIRSNESFVGEFVDQYFNQAFQMFLHSRQQFEEQFKRATNLSTAAPPNMDWAKQMWSMFPNPSRGTGAAQDSSAPPPEGDSPEKDLKAQLRRMQEELDRLKKDRKG